MLLFVSRIKTYLKNIRTATIGIVSVTLKVTSVSVFDSFHGYCSRLHDHRCCLNLTNSEILEAHDDVK